MADLTVEILKQIRDGVTSLREGQDATNERLGEANQRLERVEGKLVQVDTGLRDLGGFMRQIALDQTRHETFHTHHVEVIEKDVADIKERMRLLEERLARGQR